MPDAAIPARLGRREDPSLASRPGVSYVLPCGCYHHRTGCTGALPSSSCGRACRLPHG
ncbi:hypothetical protein THIOKS12860016 [Thiocapsa sp. KS1]|nr:hypothetical protein THIOKS12860016 [Thiocapsa sp. KS1]